MDTSNDPLLYEMGRADIHRVLTIVSPVESLNKVSFPISRVESGRHSNRSGSSLQVLLSSTFLGFFKQNVSGLSL